MKLIDWIRIYHVVVEVVTHPYKYGHSDVGDTLVSFLKDEIDVEKAISQLKHLRQDYMAH